jgi:hypothetical protein
LASIETRQPLSISGFLPWSSPRTPLSRWRERNHCPLAFASVCPQLPTSVGGYTDADISRLLRDGEVKVIIVSGYRRHRLEIEAAAAAGADQIVE